MVDFFVVQDYSNAVLYVLKTILTKTIGNGRIIIGLVYLLLGFYMYDLNVGKREIGITCFTVTVVSAILGIAFGWKYSNTYIPVLIIIPTLIKYVSFYQKQVNTYALREFSKFTYYIHMYFVFIWTYNVFSFEKAREKGTRCFINVLIVDIVTFVIYGIVKRILKNRTKLES